MNATPPNGWYPDPTGRHAQRFWDGAQWTDHVVTGNSRSVDPLTPPTRAIQTEQPTSRPVQEESSSVFTKAKEGGQSAALAAMGGAFTVASVGTQANSKSQAVTSSVVTNARALRKDRVLSNRHDPAPKAAGWYPDPDGEGGTRYSDGSAWTGDVRPPRRPFAAAGHHQEWWALFFFGAFFLVMSFFSPGMNDGSMSPGGMVGLFFFLFLGGLALITASIYLQRGREPTTQEIENRIAEEKKEAKVKRRSANVASFFSGFGRRASIPASSIDTQAAAVAQINAISDPDTARALQNLQNLLYTQALTDDEFQAAKDKLLGPSTAVSQTEQIEQLAELHRQGVLGDLEFASAKARVLGI